MECNRKLNYQLLYAVPWGLGIRAVGQPAWQGETNQPPPQLNQFLILLQLRITPLGGLTRLHSITSGRTDRLCLLPHQPTAAVDSDSRPSLVYINIRTNAHLCWTLQGVPVDGDRIVRHFLDAAHDASRILRVCWGGEEKTYYRSICHIIDKRNVCQWHIERFAINFLTK